MLLAEAVARLSRCTPDSPQYDLVLTDMNLPDGNGISLVAFLRERGLSLPLVVITGLGDEDSAVSALRAGASDYVMKRDDYLVHLPGTLEMALRRHQTERARHASPLHVLYGEDDGQAVAATRKHFNLYASNVLLEPARSGKEILERLSLAAMDKDGGKDEAGQLCDVLLLDYQLADMTAIELLKVVHDGSFQFVNQRLCEIYGYPCDELVGRNMIDFVHPDETTAMSPT